MKKIALFLVLATSALAASAQRYSVSGKVAPGEKFAYFTNVESKTTDSVAVAADGSFRFEGDANGKLFARVGDSKAKTTVVLDGDVVVDLSTLAATGTTENELYSTVAQELAPQITAINEVIAKLRQYDRNSDEFKAAFAEYNLHQDSAYAIVSRAVLGHPQNLFPAVLLARFSGSFEDSMLRKIEASKPAYFQLSVLKPLRDELAASARRAPGIDYTDLKMADTKGKAVKLSQFVGKGKYVLVDFWASWCGPCRREMPKVKALYDQYKSKGFDIVGVSFDDNKAQWLAAIKQLKADWNHMSDLKGWESEAGKVYGIKAIPATILLDPNGKIVASDFNAEKLAEILKGIFDK